MALGNVFKKEATDTKHLEARVAKLEEKLDKGLELVFSTIKSIVEDIEFTNAAERLNIIMDDLYALRDAFNAATLTARPAEQKDSIHKVEVFNGDEASAIETYTGIKLNESDKLFSMLNTIKILPPNLIKNGRHTKENVAAICGFAVTDEMMDKVYAGYKHEAA